MLFRRLLISVYILVLIILAIHLCIMWPYATSISLSVNLNEKYNANQIIVPIRFALKQEHWVFVHFFVPFTFSMFCASFFKAIAIIYAWETIEALTVTIGSVIVITSRLTSTYFSNWIGESIGDSLIGDITIGFVGIILARYLMCVYFPCINELLKCGHVCVNRHKFRHMRERGIGCQCSFFVKHKIFFLFLLYFISGAWTEVIAGLVFHHGPPQGNNGDNPVGFPIGYLMYPFFRLLWLELFWGYAEVYMLTKETAHSMERFKSMILFVFLWVYVSSCFLLVLTYPAVFVGIGTLFMSLTYLYN